MDNQNLSELLGTHRVFFNLLRMTGAGCFLFLHSLITHANCTFTSVTGVNFGVYDVFSPSPNNGGIGSLTVNCGGGTTSFVISLSTGFSNSFISRTMKNGSNILNYNLFTNATRRIVWGDGTEGSVTQSGVNKGKTVLNVYGQIFAGQNPTIGIYKDNIIVTVSF